MKKEFFGEMNRENQMVNLLENLMRTDLLYALQGDQDDHRK